MNFTKKHPFFPLSKNSFLEHVFTEYQLGFTLQESLDFQTKITVYKSKTIHLRIYSCLYIDLVNQLKLEKSSHGRHLALK